MNSTDPRSRPTLKGSPTQGFALSSAEAQQYEKDQTKRLITAFQFGARQKSGTGPINKEWANIIDEVNQKGTLQDAFNAGAAAVKAGQKWTEADIAPALVRFQVGLSAKAAKQVQDWTDTLLAGIKNGGLNIDRAVERLWARAQVQAFTVPVIGSVTLADLRSDAFDIGKIGRAFDDIKWDQVSEQVIARLAPQGGLADTALQTVNAVRDTLTTVRDITSGISGLGGVASALGGASTLLATAMPYILVAIALIAIGEAVFDYFDESAEDEAFMKREREKYQAQKDYICTLLYAGERSHFVGTVKMRLDELAWEAVVCKRVRGMLGKSDLWKMPRPMGVDSNGERNGSTVWVTMADRHVATAHFYDESRKPGDYYTDPEWKTLAVWSTGERWDRKGIRQRDLLDRRQNDHDFKRVGKAAKAANKFLGSVITYLSQDGMSVDDKRVAFELLGIQLLEDASHFSEGLWGQMRPLAYPTNPLPPSTGLVKRDNAAPPTRPVREQPPTSTLPPSETQALGAKELGLIVNSTPASPYGQQALEVLAGCFNDPVSSFLTSRGATGPLPPRSFVVRQSSSPVPAVAAPQPSLYLSPVSQIEVAASLMFAGGQWNLAGLSVAPNFLTTSGPKWTTVTETLPLGGSVVDWCYRVVLVRFQCGHVSVAAVKVIGIVNDAPELWQKGPMKRDGSLRDPFDKAVGTVFVGGPNEPGAAVEAMTAAVTSPVGKSILNRLTQRSPYSREQGAKAAIDLAAMMQTLPTSAPNSGNGLVAADATKPLLLGVLAAIGVGAWAVTRRHA